jgi:hypothetical protein
MQARLARWAKSRRAMRDVSTEPGCSRDQEQPCPDDDGSDGSRDALTGRCETFDGDGCRHDSHRAQVHDPDDEEDRRQAATAVAAVEAEAQAVSPCRAGVRRQRTAAPRCLPAEGKVMCLPRGELERAGDQDDHTGRDRNGARQRRQLHLDRQLCASSSAKAFRGASLEEVFLLV